MRLNTDAVSPRRLAAVLFAHIESEMLIDAHAHIDQYKDDLPEAIAQTENEPILMLSNSKFLSTSVK